MLPIVQLPRWVQPLPVLHYQAGKPTRIEEERKGQGNEGQGNEGSPAPPTSTTHRQDNKGQKKEPAQLEQQGNTERRGRGRERKEKEPRQAHKPTKKGHPPHMARSRQPFPSSQIRAKKSAKSRLGRFEKIFGKIFRGNVSWERKTPCVLSTEGGCLTNENREISNLGNAKNQKRTKALLNNRGQR